MPVVLVGQVIVKNEGLWQSYLDGVAQTLKPFKADLKYTGEKAFVLAGDNTAQRVVIIEFESASTAQSWYDSAAYQSLISLRDKAADVNITVYDLS